MNEASEEPAQGLPSGSFSLPEGLPPAAELTHVAFLPAAAPGQTVLFELPRPLQRVAVAGPGKPSPSSPVEHYWILTVPREVGAGATNGSESPACKLQKWVEQEARAGEAPGQALALQGAQVYFGGHRCALVAPAERLPALRQAALEVLFYEKELREVEQMVGEAWPQLEADMPCAFAGDERTLAMRQQLRQRFLHAQMIRARLARLGPYIDVPHLHPPTLASQVGERLRERMRLVQRLEFLEDQAEVFGEVYAMCGERTSDFALARSSNTLEWIVIVLLFTQVLLYGFELLAGLG